jgi:hypothetical protein
MTDEARIERQHDERLKEIMLTDLREQQRLQAEHEAQQALSVRLEIERGLKPSREYWKEVAKENDAKSKIATAAQEKWHAEVVAVADQVNDDDAALIAAFNQNPNRRNADLANEQIERNRRYRNSVIEAATKELAATMGKHHRDYCEAELQRSRIDITEVQLGAISDHDLFNLGMCWSITGNREEWDAALAEYNKPDGVFAKDRAPLAALVKAFIKGCGGPFTIDEINLIRENQRQEANALANAQASLAEVYAATARVHDATERMQLVNQAVANGTRWEDLKVPE